MSPPWTPLFGASLRGSGSPEAPYHEASRPLQDELLSLVLRVKPSLARRVDPNKENEGGWKQWVAGMLNVSRLANRVYRDPTPDYA